MSISSSSSEVFQGNWKIVECINISKCRSSPPARIEGAVFTLQDNGEIRWDLSSNNNSRHSATHGGKDDVNEIDAGFPLFQCDCYEIVHSFVGISIQMGAISGHMFEFWIDRQIPRDTMLLTFEGWIMLQCQQIKNIYAPTDSPFSLLPAFTEGFFSDIAVNAKYSGSNAACLSKEFKIHSVIMKVSEGKVEELSSLPPDVLETTLHYLYSLSLPSTLTKETVTRCIRLAPSDMSEFVSMCKKYLHRILLKQKILNLVNEVHTCAEAMSTSFHEDTVTNPTRFCSVIKIILRHGAVAFIKLVELCVLYGEEATQLERNERLEILRYAKTRLPIFLTQFVALLRNIKNDFASVKSSERNDIASCITPEIENLLDLLSNLMRETKDACNDIWVRWSKECNMSNSASGEYTTNFGNTGYNPNTNYGYGFWQDCQPLLETFPVNNTTTSSSTGSSSSPNSSESASFETLVDSLFGIFRKREIMKLHSVQGQVAAVYLYLAQKKENFEEMTTAVKVRCVARNLEQLLEELPIFLLRLEEIMIAFDDRFQWKDFKFCLQLAISQVHQTVQHLITERDRLQKFFLCLVDLVQRDEFYQSLVNLNLLITQANQSEEEGGQATSLGITKTPDDVIPNQSQSIKSEETDLLNSNIPEACIKLDFKETVADRFGSSIYDYERKNKLFYGFIDSEESGIDELNLLENLCTPMRGKESILAANCAKLYNSSEFSDMIFEIPLDDEKENLEIPSHRVIVAARCDWFRRALLSGMRESIQKRIVIHDCSPQIFQLFLNYVYTGQLENDDKLSGNEPSSSSVGRIHLDTLSDLIALADRYELDSLKLTCEQEMIHKHLDENSVIFLLSMADQYNARSLRGACMEYIASNPDIMAKDLFEQLSPELQMEVYDITMWSKPKICLI